MRYTNDDFNQVAGENLQVHSFNYPVEVELMGFMQDPLIAAEIDGIIEDAEEMGLDMNDAELMGGLISAIVGKIKTAVKKRRARKAAASSPAPVSQGFQLSTPQGTAAIGPGGISWTGVQPGRNVAMQLPGQPGQYYPAPQSSGGITDMLKNPLVIAGIVGIPVLFMLMKRRSNNG